MAKKKKGKKKKWGSRKQRAALKKAQRASLKARGYGKKKSRRGKKKGKKKGKKGKKAKRKGGHHRGHGLHGGALAARARFNTLVKRLEAKGYDRKTAEGLAHRASRIHGAMKRGVEKQKVAERAQAQAMSNLFGGIGAAGHLAAVGR